MSSRISIGRPLKSIGRPVELLYRTSPRAEDLVDYDAALEKLHRSLNVAITSISMYFWKTPYKEKC